MKIRVGLIGTRRNKYGIGQFVAREVLNNSNADLVAIMGTTPETVQQAITDLNKRQDVLNKFNGKTYVTDQADEFLKNIDLVIICSPKETHEDYIKKALTANKHVLVEKPLIHNLKIPFEERVKRSHDLMNIANKKKLFLSTNCQRAAAVYDLSEKLNLPSQPSSVNIELNASSKGKNLETNEFLFDLLIAHPLSLLVKYGFTDFRSINVKDYSKQFSKQFNSNSSSLTIKGSYLQKSYKITLQQTKEDSPASMQIKLDDNPVVEITTENNDGKLRTKYTTKNSSFYSEDHLKICINKMVDTIYNSKEPLITNDETYYIYTLQEKLRDLIH